ncbi:MAG: hypothetical protein OK449_04240 [Thaumarchaeota archaeon]|nr:hypothetical protein [Nitrososphaerota archaeon]
MSSSELRRMNKLRQVMRLSARGNGMAASLVETFRGSRLPAELSAVRSILLGRPLEESVGSMMAADDRSSDLLIYLVQQAKIDAPEASRRADKLALLFEHWVRAKQDRIVEQRIMETRSIMVSAILGGVTAMAAALAPALSTFQLTFAQLQPSPAYTEYLGLLFVIPGALFLGLFFSPRRALLNMAISGAAYLMVVYFFAPLVVSI